MPRPKGYKVTDEEKAKRRATAAAHGKEFGNPRLKAKRGEEGYHERNTAAASAACAKKREELAAEGKGDKTCIFPDAQVFRQIADAYFEHCDAHDEVYSIAGLCLWLSDHNDKSAIVTRAKLQQWWNGDAAKHLQEVVQYECLKIQKERESGKVFLEPKMAGARNFDLKQIMMGGYTDKQEVDNNMKFEVTIKDYDKELAK